MGADALLDTGSKLSHLNKDFNKRLKVDLDKSDCFVGLALKECSSKGLGKKCLAPVELNGHRYDEIPFIVLEHFLTDIILGKDFMNKHENVNIHLGCPLPTLHLGALQLVKSATPVHRFNI